MNLIQAQEDGNDVGLYLYPSGMSSVTASDIIEDVFEQTNKGYHSQDSNSDEEYDIQEKADEVLEAYGIKRVYIQEYANVSV